MVKLNNIFPSKGILSRWINMELYTSCGWARIRNSFEINTEVMFQFKSRITTAGKDDIVRRDI